MPPKPKKSEPGKKTDQKKKEKVIEDKTFGLKNKKGSKQQKFIKKVENQVQHGSQSTRQLQLAQQDSKDAKKVEKKKAQEELNSLFKPVEQKVSKGVDPKSVLCAFFKSGQCKKGDKCKFSHDMNIARKGEKRNVYGDADEKDDTMDNWDEEMLNEVVNKKHGESNKTKPQTSIICKFFLEAVENSKYGWFWQCPNGDGCHYRHALPPGFILKKDVKKEEKQNEISLEELIEKERAALSSHNLTKVTLVTFLKWKERKRREKAEKALEEVDKKRTDYKAGFIFGISGREMFEFNPDLVIGDDEEADDEIYKRPDDDEDEEGDGVAIHEINLDQLNLQERSETIAPEPSSREMANGNDTGDRLTTSPPLPDAVTTPADLEGACAAAAPHARSVMPDAELEIDENLFDGDDLDLVEDELDDLDDLDL